MAADHPTTEEVRWTTADLEVLPDDGARYELIAGELWMTRAPHWKHQEICGIIFHELFVWSQANGQGRAGLGPGVLFSDIDNVIPDVVWISTERLELILDAAGHLTGAPELVVEVLSPGEPHERRDRQARRKLYSTHGVQEYWIVDWQRQQVEVYRREQAHLRLVATLFPADELQSPLLPGFACQVAQLFL